MCPWRAYSQSSYPYDGDFYKDTPEYKRVYKKDSFDNWDVAIDTLTSWGIFWDDVTREYKKLRDIRHQSIHFRPEVDVNDRELALSAIAALSTIIAKQFGAFGMLPWFITTTKGAAFIKQSIETQPFIMVIYLPNCHLVGPYHKLEPGENESFKVVDDYAYEDAQITDEQFSDLFNNNRS